jgi:hypothetical protein
MSDAPDIIQLLRERVGHAYHRPIMFGGSPEGVDAVLHCYHELWAAVLGRDQEFEAVWSAVRAKSKCGASGFASGRRGQRDRPADPEVMEFVVTQWREVDRLLNLIVPAEPLESKLQIQDV